MSEFWRIASSLCTVCLLYGVQNIKPHMFCENTASSSVNPIPSSSVQEGLDSSAVPAVNVFSGYMAQHHTTVLQGVPLALSSIPLSHRMFKFALYKSMYIL